MSVIAKIAVITACSLATGEHRDDYISKYLFDQVYVPVNETCSMRPCEALQGAVKSIYFILIPVGIAVIAWGVGCLPTMVLRSKTKVQGIKQCLWVLVSLYLHMFISCMWYKSGDRVQAYVWILHSSCQVLASWGQRYLLYQGLQRVSVCLGVLLISGFAWYFGPPLGLAGWHSGVQAQCGLSSHLVAVLGVEFVGWGVGVVGNLLVY